MLAAKDATWMPASALVAQAVAANVEGVSFLGDEPTAQSKGHAADARDIRARSMSVMIYTGYTLEELRARNDDDTNDLLKHTDLLVDGRYDESLRTLARRWIGSDNQALHYL